MIEDNFLLQRIKNKILNNENNKGKILQAKSYYKNQNDIVDKGVTAKSETKDPLRNADNRIPHNIHQLLVDEKVSYLLTYPPIISVEDENITEQINNILGENYSRKLKNVAIESSNAGVGWIHYWIDTKEERQFKYEVVNTEEIIPVYQNGLEKNLESIIRYYTVKEEVENELEERTYVYIEYWSKDKFIKWKMRDSYTNSPESVEKISHDLGEVPFIEFDNNRYKTNDLDRIKQLLDLRDKVISGFANDIEDIQQIIYILQNYGGTDLNDFLNDLKRFKAIKVDDDGTGASGGIETLSINIPVEARNVLTTYLKDQIYEAGQGLQQDISASGSLSGVALKFFYRKLELKAGLMETEFRSGIDSLVKAILKFINVNADYKITQTWTRNMINNDLETSQIAQASVGIISKKTILENHPWVSDVQIENDRLEEEKQQEESIFEQEYNMQQEKPAEVGEEVVNEE